MEKSNELFGYDFRNLNYTINREFIDSYIKLLKKIEKLEDRLADLEITQKFSK